jgi:3-hydroxyisobutyrate dehydrogenase-like beta-hydroxyacid dehydrogenase
MTQTIGILYPGEMGSVLGRAIAARGHRVATCLTGRGEHTRRGAETFEALPSLSDLVARADVVLSVVPPAAACSVARQFAAAAADLPAKPLYVDLNAVSPLTVREVATLVACAGVDMVDGAIHGLASRFGQDSVLYLSGERAPEIEKLFGGMLPIRMLGRTIGKASALKMLTGGVNKGLAGLFLELSATAQRAGLLNEFLDACSDKYPAILSIAQRILPSYTRHADRRCDELKELARSMADWGIEPGAVDGAARTVGKIGTDRNETGAALPELLRRLSADLTR